MNAGDQDVDEAVKVGLLVAAHPLLQEVAALQTKVAELEAERDEQKNVVAICEATCRAVRITAERDGVDVDALIARLEGTPSLAEENAELRGRLAKLAYVMKLARDLVKRSDAAKGTPILSQTREQAAKWESFYETTEALASAVRALPEDDSVVPVAPTNCEKELADTREEAAFYLAYARTLDRLRALRRAGWMVAVHNDYRLAGEPHTFWLMTHPDGRYIKGEGRSDEEVILDLERQAQ